MKKLDGPEELQVGHIYNTVYVGSNKAYARINGKKTILVTQAGATVEYWELYDRFAHPFTDDLRSGPVTCRSPKMAFDECEIYEPESEAEWFKKSVRTDSIAEAIERKCITKGLVQAMRPTPNAFTPYFDGSMQLKGVYTHIDVEGRTEFPHLQTLFIVWKDWDSMRADFARHGVIVPR